ncbi:hypothetical protein BGZ83_002645 [Gryganskiella cystojenkinii]|nr:hypothetical protein BGZ83_002645 [Gryganskiella cystojenkinii]
MNGVEYPSKMAVPDWVNIVPLFLDNIDFNEDDYDEDDDESWKVPRVAALKAALEPLGQIAKIVIPT